MLHDSSYQNTFDSLLSSGTVYTHSGGIHADDVLSTALINLYCDAKGIDRPEVVRISDRDLTDDIKNNNVVFDIGGGDFDHHQSDNESHETGEPYAAFGKLFNVIGETVFGEDADVVEEEFVKIIDLCDNSSEDNPISQTVREQLPLFGEKFTPDDAFESALAFCENVLVERRDNLDDFLDNDISLTDLSPFNENEVGVFDKRTEERKEAFENIREIVAEKVEGKTSLNNGASIIKLDSPGIPFKLIAEQTGGTDIIGYTFPARGSISFKPLIDNIVPVEWRGETKENLEKVVPGMNFVHNAGITVSFDDEEALEKGLDAIVDSPQFEKAVSDSVVSRDGVVSSPYVSSLSPEQIKEKLSSKEDACIPLQDNIVKKEGDEIKVFDKSGAEIKSFSKDDEDFDDIVKDINNLSAEDVDIDDDDPIE